MTRNNRHKAILAILKENKIENQDTLLNILVSNGFNITQATLSRDIKKLKIIKAPTNSGAYTYQLAEDMQPMETDLGTMAALGFLKIEFSGQLAVIKTRPGYAMAIASEIDHKSTDYVLGTVAGDDTILIIPKENKTREEIVNSLSTFIPNLK